MPLTRRMGYQGAEMFSVGEREGANQRRVGVEREGGGGGGGGGGGRDSGG